MVHDRHKSHERTRRPKAAFRGPGRKIPIWTGSSGPGGSCWGTDALASFSVRSMTADGDPGGAGHRYRRQGDAEVQNRGARRRAPMARPEADAYLATRQVDRLGCELLSSHPIEFVNHSQRREHVHARRWSKSRRCAGRAGPRRLSLPRAVRMAGAAGYVEPGDPWRDIRRTSTNSRVTSFVHVLRTGAPSSRASDPSAAPFE